MARNSLPSLLKEYDKLLFRSKGESAESIKVLKSIVQFCVEQNDDLSAYQYQQKLCSASAQVYGRADIAAKRAQLYCRELMIRSAPVEERVQLCREFWQDAKGEYGENSYLVRILAPLYMTCCYEADEIEELKIVCREIVSIFGENDDLESRQLAALCSDFDIIIGEKSGDIQQLQAACQRAESAFGKNSIYELRLQSEIALIYRKNREFERAAEIQGRLFRLARDMFGTYALDTISFQKNYVLDLAFSGHLRAALKEAGHLERAAELCPDKNQCPDIYECFVYIYMRLGKEKLVEKYSGMSLSFRERNAGADDLDTLKAKFMIALRTLTVHPNDPAAFRAMIEYMAAKEQSLYKIYLLSSDIGREKYFSIQNRGEYDACFGVVLNARTESTDDEKLLELWEVVCNYKSLMGDCEFLHSALRQKENLSKEIDGLEAALQSQDREIVIEAEKRLLEISKSADFPGYVNSVNVREIQKNLRDDELLLDYYCVHFSDLEVYAVIVAEKHSLALFQLDDIRKVDAMMEQVIRETCSDNGSVSSGEGDDRAKASGRSADGLTGELFASIIPKSRLPHKVIICPDGELYRLSFELLIETAQIVYVTNPKDIVRGRKDASYGRPPFTTVNIFADPFFSLREEHTKEISPERFDKLSRLPGTLAEAAVIQRIYGNRARSFTHFDANEQMFLQNCNADIIHIGTHSAPADGGILFLAGANEPVDDTERPVFGKGYLTSTDIAKLNMGHTRLVVLSACQTGIGEYRSYLGVRGLRRAFQIAGAASVVATHWNISDIAAAIFMYEFYLKYRECENAVTALHDAKNCLKKATVSEIKERIYPVISDILINSDNIEAYREFRDIIVYGQDTEIPFSSPYYWAAFSIYDSFRDETNHSNKNQ